jgi:tetratricopeptide (TPR) repeat protein
VFARESECGQIERAHRLRDAGDLAGALQLLEAVLAEHPDDVEAARLLAQTLYWVRDFARARAAYEEAVLRHRGHVQLRLEYGRMLVETGDRATARAVLRPLREVPAARAEAEALLGTLAYWDGDLTAARDFFMSALRADPAQRDAARQLREVETLIAPWLRVSATLWHDDQPLERVAAGFEAGWFPTPLVSIKLRSQPTRYTADATSTLWANEVEIAHVAPASRIETEVAGGVLRRAGAIPMDWTGRAALGGRVGAGVTVRGRLERAPYLYTLASLETPVMTDTATASLHVNHSQGWLAEAAHQRQRYPDGNIVRTSYVWVLAPLLRQPRHRLQAGYAVALADADEDRFVPARPLPRLLPGSDLVDGQGRYEPYYTPQRVLTHSVTGALTVGGSPGPLLRLSGSYAVRAAEDATVFLLTGNQIRSEVTRREFTPWTLRATVEVPASEALSIEVTGEFGRTAFYRWRTAGLHVVYRFTSHAGGGDRSR